MKFYSRILGDRDYSLFEVVHFGLRLPAVLSSFTPVTSASVSNWASLKKTVNIATAKPSDRITYQSKLEQFSNRAYLKRPARLPEDDIKHISFYAFWRMFGVHGNRLVKHQRETMIAVTGSGWQSQAARTHEHHAEYCRKNLYAYMPCAEFCGTEYIDRAAELYYNNDYAAFFQDFCTDVTNKWCPPWIKHNYAMRNKDVPTTKPTKAP